MPLPEGAILRAEESEQTRIARERLTRSNLSIHAEERETSLIMRWFPQLLNENVDVRQLVPVLPSSEQISAATGGGKWR
jgi:creatinine amidohydrolase/Fe(II)-dependent formamide hydrolase-like protein